MKNYCIVLDGDGKPHTHELFKGKEFVSSAEVITAINDYNRENPGKKLKGKIEIKNFIEF